MLYSVSTLVGNCLIVFLKGDMNDIVFEGHGTATGVLADGQSW